MKILGTIAALCLLILPGTGSAQKLTLAFVAINPGQGVLWIAKESGLLSKHGLNADVVLIPGSPRTVQSLIAGDIDFAIAGTPAFLRARAQGADVVILSALYGHVSQRVLLRPDSTVSNFRELKGKLVGVTQYGSAGDTFFRAALKKSGMKDTDVTILQLGGTPQVSQAMEAGKIEVGVLGDSSSLLVFRGKVKPLRGGSSREMGFLGLDAPLGTTERKIKADRGAVVRFMQSYVEAIHYFKTNKVGTIRIMQKYMRGLTDEHLGMWYEEYRESLRPLPYPEEDSLRGELEQITPAPRPQPASYYLYTSILDEIKKNGFVDKLYKQ